jgi:hypothetical protein
MTRSQDQRSLRLTLAVLLPLAATSALAALLRLPGPQVGDLSESTVRHRLAEAGFSVRTLPSVAPWRSDGIALSTLRSYQLQPGLELRLQRVKIWRRADFQLAYMTRPWTEARRDLALGGPRRVVRGPAGFHAIAGRGTAAVRQTCLLAGPGRAASGVTAAQLGALADQRASGPAALAARLVGLEPNRSWQCLLVSLHSDRQLQPGPRQPGSRQPGPRVDGLWARLMPALTEL